MLMTDKDMGNIIYISLIISLDLLICITTFQNSFSLINTKSPFSESNATIKSISSSTSDGKYFINLQYGPEVKKGELGFFMVNMFNNNGDKQIRMRHVDLLSKEMELNYSRCLRSMESLFFTQLMGLCYRPSDSANLEIIQYQLKSPHNYLFP